MCKFKIGDIIVRKESSPDSSAWKDFLKSSKSEGVLVVTNLYKECIGVNGFKYLGDTTPFSDVSFELSTETIKPITNYCSNLLKAHRDLEDLKNLYKETWNRIKTAQKVYDKSKVDLSDFMKSYGIEDLE